MITPPGIIPLSRARVLASTMFTNMSKYFPHWSILADMVSPNRFNDVAYSHFSPLKGRKRIVKSEPALAFRIYKAGMTNGATPKGRRWFQYTTMIPKLKRMKKAQDYYAYATEVAEDVLQMSNFYRIMPEANGDMGLFSNAAFMMLPDAKTGVYFYPFQMGTYAFQANLKGEVTMFVRRLSMTVDQYVKEFGSLKPNGHIDWSNIPPYIKLKWEQHLYTDLVYMIHLVTENPYYIEGKPIFHSYQKKYQSYYWIDHLDASVPPQQSTGFREEVVANGGKDAFNDYASVRGFDYFPVIVPRWTVPFGHSVGCEGPGDIALNSMIVFQQMERDRLLAIEKILKPPMVASTSLKRAGASILPGGVTYMEPSEMQTAGFKPAFTVDPKIAELVLNSNELEMAFEEAFYKDIFLQFARQDMISHVSAAEINERSAEKLAIINPMISQYDDDVGSKVLGNIIIIGEAEGFMPIKPRELEGIETSIQYMSILANASKASLMGSLDRTMAFAGNVASLTNNPLLLRIVKGEESVKAYAEWAGLDPRFIASDEEIAEYAQQMQQQQQQQAQMESLLKQSEIAKNISAAQPSERGSYIDNMNSASQV